MAKKIFAYHIDNESEAEGFREVLDEANITHYSTPGSRWGFSLAAIWLKNDEDHPRALELLQTFQQHYAQQARQQYQQETGYRPDAPLAEKIRFLLAFWSQRPAAIILVFLGFGLIFFAFYEIYLLLATPLPQQ